ncbi:MAG: hypothetical protein DRJ03_19265 [Chloroflexi bacterium]|nr:MAG: hypothetical protein DRJ03_19265 [Chloroflexota bacterium]
MGEFSLNGTFTYLPDPSGWVSDGLAEVGTFTNGAPILQGLESGTLTWAALTQQEYGELHTRWDANKGNAVAGKLPEESGSSLATYDTVASAYWHEPRGRAHGKIRHNVTMRVTSITRS